MQIRCTNCHRPFALGKAEINAALDLISTQGLSHYDAHCPHCRRVNRVSPKALRRGAPEWKKPVDDQSNTD